MQHPSKALCNCTTKGCSVCRQHDLEWKLTRLSLDHDLTTWWGTLWTLDQSIEQSCWRISWNILKLSIEQWTQWIQWIQWSLEISFISQQALFGEPVRDSKAESIWKIHPLGKRLHSTHQSPNLHSPARRIPEACSLLRCFATKSSSSAWDALLIFRQEVSGPEFNMSSICKRLKFEILQDPDQL